MDIGKVLSRAWQITWRYKILWLLGFLASLSQGGPGSTFTYTTSGEDFQQYPWWEIEGTTIDLERFFNEAFWGGIVASIVGIICVVMCVVFVIAIVIWVISVIARGGLIAAVGQIEEDGSTGFRKAWVVGRKKFWTLFGLSVLAAIPVILFALVVSIMLGLGIALGVGILDADEAAGITTMVLAASVFGCLLCCGLLVLGIVLEQIRVYGERAAILEDMGWIDAFKRGWQVIRENLGPTVILWLIFVALGLVILLVMIPFIFLFVVPFIPIFTLSDMDIWSMIGLVCLGSLLFAILIMIIRSIVTVFTSATWTLAYREFTGMTALSGPSAPVVVPPPVVDESPSAELELPPLETEDQPLDEAEELPPPI